MITAHRYEASFRVSGVDVDPDALSARAGISPDATRRKGDRKSADKTWPDSMWEIRSKAQENSDLAVHIENLIARIAPKINEIRAAGGKGAKLFFWCAHFTNAEEGFCGGPELKSELLSKIGELGIDLHLQTYSGTEM